MSLIDYLSSDFNSPPLLALLIAAMLAVGLFWGQNRLSRSRHRWLGGILPALFLGFAITMLVAFPDARTVGFALQFGFGLLVLLVMWWLGNDDVPIATEDTPPAGPEA